MKATPLTSCILWVFIGTAAWAAGEASYAERRQVSAHGRVEPEGGVVKVAAPHAFSAPQIVKELLAKRGDAVTQGQVLATLDSEARLQAALAVAEAQVALAQSRSTQAQTRLRGGEVESAAAAAAGAQIELEHAERELKRSTHLDQQAAVAQMDIDKWQTEVNVKRTLLQKMQHSHAALRDTLAAELNTAAAALKVAQAEADRARAEAAYGKVLAPCAGHVLKTFLHAGEAATSPLLELGDTRTMNVIAEVYETDVRFVKVGAQARITSQALPAALSGRVVGIGLRVSKRDAFSVDPAARTDGRVVEVKVRLDDPAAVAGLTNLEVDAVITAP